MAGETYRYGSGAYGAIPYGGEAPATLIPTRNVSGIIFFTANDRYQVITCSYGGTIDTVPEFRYWYANAPGWGETLAGDTLLPDWFSDDEDGAIPVGSLELPYRQTKSPQEMRVEGVTVEFIPRPSIINESGIGSADNIGFTAKVEGIGVPDFTRDAENSYTSGVVQSDPVSYSLAANDAASTEWPNIITVNLRCRLLQNVRAARVILTDISLCEILSVQLRGSTAFIARER